MMAGEICIGRSARRLCKYIRVMSRTRIQEFVPQKKIVVVLYVYEAGVVSSTKFFGGI